MLRHQATPTPSRAHILHWIASLLPDSPPPARIEELGKGTTYCRIINHYHPGAITLSRIIAHPKTEYENMLNLRILQHALNALKIHIPIDPLRLSKEKLNDNWNMINSLYKHLAQQEEPPSEDTPSFHPAPVRRALEPLVPAHLEHGVNGSKFSVGKGFREGVEAPSPCKGKWSVNSHMFHNNFIPIIERVKEILLKPAHDVEKIRQVKMLLNIPLNEEVVKVEEDDKPIIALPQPAQSTPRP